MEDRLTEQISNLRRAHSVVIADLPGGKHGKTAHGLPGTAQRIPPHREYMMEQIDAFIVLERKDRRTATYWRDELQQHGLAERIGAVLQSDLPGSQMTVDIDEAHDPVRGTVCGLDRGRIGDMLPARARAAFSTLLDSVEQT